MTPEERLKALAETITSANELADVYNRVSSILSEQNSSINGFLNTQNSINERLRQRTTLEKTILSLKKEEEEIIAYIEKREREGGLAMSQIEHERIKLLKQRITLLAQNKEIINDELSVINQERNALEAIGNELISQTKSWLKQEFGVKSIWSYLQKIDGGIRSMQLSMGITGERAEDFRRQMEGAVNISARFGVNMEQLVQMQSTLNETTGRANVLSENQVGNMVLIAKGTGMANEEAAAFLGNMMNIGSSINDSTKFIEGTVNETAKLGLNSSTVLKGITSNIGKLNQYRFQGGLDGLKKMVQESTKFKVSMENAFAVADKFRTLEGLLEAGAQLRVLGGEFAKMDEFKISFLARNEPEKLTAELAKMTKGMASFNKETGVFEVSDINMDILRSAAEATNQDFTKLVESAKKFNQVSLARKQIIGGTEEDKEIIANLATFQKGSSIATIEIDGKNFKVNELTGEQISLLRQQEKTLKQRAEDSQNFNETFDNTVMQLKASLLPLLVYINDTLKWFNGIMDGWRESTGKMKSIAGILPIGGLLFGATAATAVFSLGGGLIKSLVGLIAGGIGGAFRLLTGGISSLITLAPGAAAAAVSLIELGAAVALIGAGVGAAGYGLGKMFEGFNTENLNFTGLESLNNVDFNNMDKLKVLQNFKESDIERMNEMFDILNRINSIDLSKLDNLGKLFASGTMKVTLDGNPVIKNDITIDIDGDKFYKKVERMIPIIVKKGLMPK